MKRNQRGCYVLEKIKWFENGKKIGEAITFYR